MKYVLAALGILLSASAQAQEARVIATIKPLHSLVAAVMEGSGDAPVLLVDGNATPHNFQLRPTQVQALQNADIVFAIGAQMEPFLQRAQGTLSARTQLVLMAEQQGMFLLPARSGGNFQPHGHEGMEMEPMADYQAQAAGNSGYDAMKSGMQDQANWAWSGGKSNPGAASNAPFSRQAIEQMRRDSAAQMLTGPTNANALSSGGNLTSGGLAGPATVAVSGADPHIWLDPMNAITMVDIIVQRLSALYPNDARTYQNNAQAIQQRIADTDADIRTRLRYVAGKPFVVFHDAYQYFEKAFGLHSSASVLLSPEVMPGAAHLLQVRDAITQSGAVCVFSEPQFDDALVARVVGSAPIKRGVLDPEGAALANGPTLYPALLMQLADQFESCLK